MVPGPRTNCRLPHVREAVLGASLTRGSLARAPWLILPGIGSQKRDDRQSAPESVAGFLIRARAVRLPNVAYTPLMRLNPFSRFVAKPPQWLAFEISPSPPLNRSPC